MSAEQKAAGVGWWVPSSLREQSRRKEASVLQGCNQGVSQDEISSACSAGEGFTWSSLSGCWQDPVAQGLLDDAHHGFSGCWLEATFNSLSYGPLHHGSWLPQSVQGGKATERVWQETEVTVFCNLTLEMTSIPFAVCCWLEVQDWASPPSQRGLLTRVWLPGGVGHWDHPGVCLPQWRETGKMQVVRCVSKGVSQSHKSGDKRMMDKLTLHEDRDRSLLLCCCSFTES